jgi:hypothetical protein
VLLCAPTPADAVTKSLLNAALESVTANELYHHVEVLADDIYEGRAAGSRGGHAAAKYIVNELRQYPLQPAGTNGDYVQAFDDDWRNILVLLPGDDPELADELIVVGAHYDHVGRGNDGNSYGPAGRIHNGADDNASGVSMLLETIESFASTGLKTRRSILFAFWDGEERNLKGSKYWLEHTEVLPTNIKLAVTIDMVGRLREGQLYVLGSRSGYGMRQLLSGPVEEPLWLDFIWELTANSDHWSFMEKDVPSVLLHTGLHGDYHRPSDDAEKINREGLREVSRYLVAMLIKVANADELPKFRPAVRHEMSESKQRAAERPLARLSLRNWPYNQPRPKLGISWRGDEAEPGAVFLTRVVDGSPADAAGLKVHDRLVEIDDQPFADAAEFEKVIHGLLNSGANDIRLRTERVGHVRTLTVKLPSSL